MKKTIFSILALSLFMLISCNNTAQNKGKNEDAKNQTMSQASVKQLNKVGFIDKIMDYETNPTTWIYKGEIPSVVDFYADWCRPCKIVAPIMEELAKEYEGRINIYKVDVDQEKELSQYFRIESIPAILFIPLKGEPSMQAGAMSKEQYRKIFDEFLLKKTADATQK